MTQKLKKRFKLRAAIVGFFFLIAFGAIGARAVQLHVFNGPWLSSKAENEFTRSTVLRGKRGTVYDRNKNPLAISIESTSVAAYPKRIKDKKAAAVKLAAALGEKRSDIRKKLKSKSNFVWLKRQVAPKKVHAVRQLEMAGVDFVPENSRYYPNRLLAAQILGFTGIDGHGLEGVEFFYDAQLKGREKKITVLKDAHGNRFGATTKLPPDYDGNNVELTIDRNIQYIAQNALAEAVGQYGAQSGIVVVMAPSTGDILALVNYPLFNPNTFSRYGRELWRNRTVTDQFEPGSTMKIFSVAAAIDSGISSPASIFFCENGKYRIGKNVVHDTKSHGWLSLQQIVKYSSNIGAVKVVELMGPAVLHNYLKDFGFGEKTGIDCPGETPGSLSPYRRWSKIDTGAISFGHGVSVSAVQLTAAAAAIANDGVLMKPRLVKKVTDRNQRVIRKTDPVQVRRVISSKTAKTMRRIMKSVITEGGTGVNAALEGYTVSGKTGTAQKVDIGRNYSNERYIASFIGFAPSENPELVILVIADEPENQYYGGVVAAPVFKKIALETLSYMNIPPGTDVNRLRVSRDYEAKG